MTNPPVPLIVRRIIQSSPERVFDAFNSSVALAQWFTPSPDIGVDVLEFDFVVGGRFRLRYSMSDGREPVVGGAYEVIESPSRIVMTWVWEAPDELAGIPMRVTFDFSKKVEATEVVITHEGIPSDQVCTVHEDGWEGSFNRLMLFLETWPADSR